jgi:hypothetical protein
MHQTILVDYLLYVRQSNWKHDNNAYDDLTLFGIKTLLKFTICAVCHWSLNHFFFTLFFVSRIGYSAWASLLLWHVRTIEFFTDLVFTMLLLGGMTFKSKI